MPWLGDGYSYYSYGSRVVCSHRSYTIGQDKLGVYFKNLNNFLFNISTDLMIILFHSLLKGRDFRAKLPHGFYYGRLL